MPISTEMAVASDAAEIPMITDSCAPYRQRENMSRPRLSVPNRNSSDGGLSRLTGLIWFMPYGASQSAKMPQKRNSTKMTPLAAPRGLSRNSRRRNPAGLRAGPGMMLGAGMAMADISGI